MTSRSLVTAVTTAMLTLAALTTSPPAAQDDVALHAAAGVPPVPSA